MNTNNNRKSRKHPQNRGRFDRNSVTQLVPNSEKPIRFEHLRPGSYFKIFAEPSRRIYRSSDPRMYQKAYDGFFAFHTTSPAACCLMPNDLVIPYREQRLQAAD